VGEATPVSSVGVAGAGSARRVRHGRAVEITGSVAPRTAGVAVRLEYARRGRAYRRVRRAATRKDGSYRFVVRARRSGSYRVAVEPPVGTATAARAVASRPLRVTVVARLGGTATRHAVGGRAVRVRGRLWPALGGRRVSLQLRAGGAWRTLERTRTRRGGRFSASWRPRGIGSYRLRVRFAGDRAAAAVTEQLGATHVYRAGHASWYGPGFYGNTTACGRALTPGSLGVAHKWLPCGTRVTFRYGRRSVTVPVIDRGPYAAGRDWDLTAATKAKLGFGSTGTVWSTR
jgi:rare lipoprotein A